MPDAYSFRTFEHLERLERVLRTAALALLLALLGAAGARADDFAYRLEGLDGALEENVTAQLQSQGLSSITVAGRYRSQIRSGVKKGLRALGYYEPVVKLSWEDGVKGDRSEDQGSASEGRSEKSPDEGKGGKTAPRMLIVKVDPGEPVRIAGAELALSGEAAEDPDFRKLLDSLPEKGRVLHHGEYEAFKKSVLALGTRKGYFLGRFTKSELAVAASRREAWWRLAYDSGPRWKFGEVAFTGSQIDADILARLVPFERGGPYASEKLAELNENLADTGWFSSAVVAPAFRQAGADHELPLAGALTPRKGNSVEVGVGYSTDVGPRFTGEWTKPWVNSSGHSLTVSTSLSMKEPELSFSYKMPLRDNPLEEYWLAQGGFKHTDINDTRSEQTTFEGSRYWNFATGWQRSVNLRWMLDNYSQGETNNTTMLLYPGVTINRTRSRGGAMPSWGDSQRYSIDVSQKLWGSDVNFWSANASGVIIRTFASKNRFIGRYALGWIQADDFDAVPPDLRFFAGGDRSIRGYDYKSLSPRDGKGELRGAKRLVTGSLEYQRNLTGDWWGAVFVDAGEATDSFSTGEIKTGAGVGIRWKSPVGPVKFDIARPVGDSEHHGFAFYIGLGPEL